MSPGEPERGGESTFGPVAVLMSGRAAGQLAAFFIPVVLVRVFAPAAFGNYKRIFLLYGTLYGIAQLGFAESLYYFLPRFPGSAGKLVVNAVLALAGSGAICLALLTAGSVPVARWLGDAALGPELPLAALFLALMLISATLEIALVARKRRGLASLSYLGSDFVRAACLIAPVLLFASLRALLAGAVVFALARLAVALASLRRLAKGPLRPDLALFRMQCGYALPFALAGLVEIAHASLHQYVVSFRYGAATFAVYSVALLQIPLVDFTTSAASAVVMVRMGEKLRDGRAGQVHTLWHDMVGKLALIFFPLVAWVLVGGREIIVLLFTGQYAESVPLFRLASLGILFAVLQTDSVMRALAQTRFLLLLNLVRLSLAALLILPALSRFGLAGAVGLMVLTTGTFRFLSMARIARVLGLGLLDLLPWRRLLLTAAAALAAGLCAWVARARLQWPPLPLLAATTAILGAAFAALALQSRLLSLPEIAWLRGWFPGLRVGERR